MAYNVENTAKITYGTTTLPPTCPVVTRVEPGLKAIKYATTDQGRITKSGIVGQSRKVTYDILLSNYSSVEFSNVEIKDSIVTDPSISADKISYVRDESMYDNSGDLPDIILKVGKVPAESQIVVHYTLQFDESVPVNTKITNTASVTYSENTNLDENGEQVPVEAGSIDVTISYSDTTIKSTKTGPENVLCGQNFDYVLVFENTGENEAANVSVEDNLPDGFSINLITVENGSSQLQKDTNYTYDKNARPLVINSVGDSLNIAAKSKLTITINGKFNCV